MAWSVLVVVRLRVAQAGDDAVGVIPSVVQNKSAPVVASEKDTATCPV